MNEPMKARQLKTIVLVLTMLMLASTVTAQNQQIRRQEL